MESSQKDAPNRTRRIERKLRRRRREKMFEKENLLRVELYKRYARENKKNCVRGKWLDLLFSRLVSISLFPTATEWWKHHLPLPTPPTLPLHLPTHFEIESNRRSYKRWKKRKSKTVGRGWRSIITVESSQHWNGHFSTWSSSFFKFWFHFHLKFRPK